MPADTSLRKTSLFGAFLGTFPGVRARPGRAAPGWWGPRQGPPHCGGSPPPRHPARAREPPPRPAEATRKNDTSGSESGAVGGRGCPGGAISSAMALVCGISSAARFHRPQDPIGQQISSATGFHRPRDFIGHKIPSATRFHRPRDIIGQHLQHSYGAAQHSYSALQNIFCGAL